MDIVLEIVSRHKYSATFPTMHVFGEAGGYIGRSGECEWELPDRLKQISRKHALISFDGGDFYIEDVSSNGVFLGLGNELIGKGRRHKVEHGESFIIGSYTIMAKLLHNPRVYASSASIAAGDISAFSKPLSSNPLTAMDQEEERIARERLGDFDDLFGGRKLHQSLLSADHSDPRNSPLMSVVAVPENPKELIPEDWDADPEEEKSGPNSSPVPRVAKAAAASQPVRKVEFVAVPETEAFFKNLGFAEAPAAAEERARILEVAAKLLVEAVTGMTLALQNRNDCKNELRLSVTTTGLGVSNNPLKFSPTAEAALATLLGPPQKGVLPSVESMHEGFENLHSHHMGLMAGARAAVRASLERISPQAVEARLDADGPVRLSRMSRLWHAFIRAHHALLHDHEGFAALFLQDFARAYEVQVRTLNPSPLRDNKGERS